MKPLDWQAEPFSPMGGINGQGVLRQLGKPTMDWAELLIREAVQNSWDARLSENKPVDFRIIGYKLTEEQRLVLCDVVLERTPHDLDPREITEVLLLQDSNTWGLSGPLRADVVQEGNNIPPNFVRFLRNVGQTHDTEDRATGGTYGFGKASYYGASSCSSIVVHSRCITADGLRHESRFLVARLAAPYPYGGKHFTGRHWWGRLGADGVADPILGDEADEMAELLGIPIHRGDQTGTSVLILNPIFSDGKPEKNLGTLAEAVARSFWPKQSDGPGGTATMTFEIRWENTPIPLPLEGHSLKTFRSAFRRAIQAEAPELKTPFFWTIPIESHRPQKRLGTLVLMRFDDPQSVHQPASEPNPLFGPCQHVAWMRTPHFVIKYALGPAALALQWAGVFVAAPDLDAAFAQAEPPTHDAWNPQHLPSSSNERTYVKMALQRIKETVEKFVTPSSTMSAYGSTGMPLGGFADSLGSLIPAVPGTGSRTPSSKSPGSTSNGGGGSSRRGRAQIKISRQRLIVDSDAPAIEIRFIVDSPGQEVVITAHAEVVLEDGSVEGDQPEGSDKPQILYWQVGKAQYDGSPKCPEVMSDGAQGIIVVSSPNDARTRVILSAEVQNE